MLTSHGFTTNGRQFVYAPQKQVCAHGNLTGPAQDVQWMVLGFELFDSKYTVTNLSHRSCHYYFKTVTNGSNKISVWKYS